MLKLELKTRVCHLGFSQQHLSGVQAVADQQH